MFSDADGVRSNRLRRITGGSLIYLAAFEARVRDWLAHRYAAHTGLRQSAIRLIASLKMNGGTEDEVMSVLTHIIFAEAARGDLNRPSMVTGLRPSDQLTDEIRAWVRISFHEPS